MSENSFNEVPDQPPLILLAGESEVHWAAAQIHSQPAPSSVQHSHSSTFVKEGQEERLTWDPPEFEPTETLSSQKDKEHSRLRREKNRGAAARCRLRRRDREERLRKNTVRLENANSGLRAEIARLQHELKGLSTHAMSHMELCHRGEEHRGTHWTTDQLAWRTPTQDSVRRWRGYSMNTCPHTS
ncbi:fos-related antigen 2-like [Branchiostoma floridae]|uniref:Fos-related antigen 2-like n=1 Tax=Branchiostoma floridae TaxID=7739 RepID=A0A9J7MM26_BRAFL|nr:fos-related antigen 2-like [Branchiostoma floridae]